MYSLINFSIESYAEINKKGKGKTTQQEKPQTMFITYGKQSRWIKIRMVCNYTTV